MVMFEGLKRLYALEQEVKQIAGEVARLQNRMTYYVYPSLNATSFPQGQELTAKEIMTRFDELYDKLGLERKIAPQQIVLAKKEKK